MTLSAAVVAVGALAVPTSTASVAPTRGSDIVCRLADERIDEASGLAVAAGLQWTHDDSPEGGRARLHGLDDACRTVAVLHLAGASPVDAEDLGVGPAVGARPVLWLADTGDNRARRARVTLVRVVVPDVGEAARPGARARLGREAPVLETPVQEYPLVYADGPRDAEALLVSPSGVPVVVSKPLVGRPGVYAPSAGLVPGAPGVLERVGDVRLGRSARPAGARPVGPAGPLSPSLVTGGALSADGTGVVLLTYTDAHLWRTGPGERTTSGPDVAALLGRPPDAVLPLPPLAQAEAVAWDEDGRSLLVTGEGSGAPVHRLHAGPRRGPAGGADAGDLSGTAVPGVPGVRTAGPSPAPSGDAGGAAGLSAARLGGAAAVVLALVAWSVRAEVRRRRGSRLARRPGG